MVTTRPTTQPAPARAIAWWSLGFVLIHVLVDLYLRLSPGDYTDLPGTRLLIIFALWFPILLLATFLSFGLPVRIPILPRLLVMAGYLVVLVAFALAGPAYGAWFDLLLRFIPVPAFFLLFADGRRWSLSRCLGVSFILFSTWRSVYFNFPDLLVIAAGGGTPGPTPTIAFYQQFFLKALWDIGYPVLGLMFFFHRVPWIHTVPTWGRELERLLRPIGGWVRRGIGVDVAIGGIIFFVNLVATIAIVTLLEQTPTGDVGDDSRVFDLLTLDLVFLLAIAAGVGEELVFRGLLQGGLERLLTRFRLSLRSLPWVGAGGLVLPVLIIFASAVLTGVGIPTIFGQDLLIAALIGVLLFAPALWKGPATVAIVVQAVAFAIVHAGYTDLVHLILPGLFGLLMGVVYRVFGLVPAILIHVEIDIVAFGAEYATSNPETEGALSLFIYLLLIANLVLGLVGVIFYVVRWLDERRRANPPVTGA